MVAVCADLVIDLHLGTSVLTAEPTDFILDLIVRLSS